MQKPIHSTWALILLFLFAPCIPCSAATIHVPADQPTIQAGVDAAVYGDTVFVASGTYTGDGNRNVVITGKAITVKSESGPDTTIVDCEEMGRGFSIGFVSTGTVVIEGFTITNGQSRESDPVDGGGAIYCRESNLLIDTCHFVGNTSSSSYPESTSGKGGAVFICSSSDATLRNCTLANNRAYGSDHSPLGGAVACLQSTLSVEGCSVSNNGISGDDGFGGGLYAKESDVRIAHSTFTANANTTYATYGSFCWGGAVYVSWSSTEVDDCDFIDNMARSWSDYGMSSIGGGIAERYGTSLTVRNSRFTGNVLENEGEIFGGGIYSSGEYCSIDNCLFHANSTDQVHASSSFDTFLEMDGCTVAGGDDSVHYKPPPAGGVYCYEGSIRNCIIRDNPEQQLVVYGEASVTYSAITGGWAGAGNLSADPLLTTGPNGVGYLGQSAAGQPLDSPCVDAGDPLSPLVDGTTRTDSSPDIGRVDIGYHHRPASGLFICPWPDHFWYEVQENSATLIETGVEIQPCMGGVLDWAVTSDAAWITLDPQSGTSIEEPVPVTVTIDPSGMSRGYHRATITIEAPDAQGSPLEIPVTLLVGQLVIGHSPSDLEFVETLLEPPPEDQVIAIWSDDLLTLEWTVSCDAPWLSMVPLSGSSTGETDEVVVHVDATGLAAGTYPATIIISDPEAENDPQTVSVEYTIRERILACSPDLFAFQCIEGDIAPPPQPIEVWNAGNGIMFYRLFADAAWIDFVPRNGYSTGQHVVNQVHVDQSGLQPGLHETLITVSSDDATNSPLLVPVTMTVAESGREPGLLTGPGPCPLNPPLVRIYPPEQDAGPLDQFSAYSASGYGTIISSADLDTDFFDEILTGPGPGEIYGPHVRGFEADGTPLPGLSFLAYGTNRYGVNVSAGDLDNDGYDEIVTGAGKGAEFGPHVRGWNYDGLPAVRSMPLVNFFAYGTPKWGVNVAAGDIDGDGFDEIVTGPGPGAVYGPHVRAWNVDGGPATAIPSVSFLAYGTNKYGVNVSAGDVDGDGIDEIVTGAGPGAVFGPHVRGWNYDGSSVGPLPGYSFFAWQTPPLTHGVKVFAGTDLNGNGRDELVTGRGPAPDADTEVKVFTYDGTTVTRWISLEAYPGFHQGVNIAAGRF